MMRLLIRSIFRWRMLGGSFLPSDFVHRALDATQGIQWSNASETTTTTRNVEDASTMSLVVDLKLLMVLYRDCAPEETCVLAR